MKNLKQLFEWIEEETKGKEPFSVEVLNSKFSLVEMKQYLVQTLGRFVADGNTRVVWNIDQDRIIKILRRREDVQQNIREVENSRCLGSHYAIQVLDHHPQFLWLIEERVEVLESKIEQHLSDFLGTEVSLETVDMLIDIGVSVQSTKPFIKNVKLERVHQKLYQENGWYTGLIDGLVKCGVGSEDFHDENWGIRPSTGELVLLDLGF